MRFSNVVFTVTFCDRSLERWRLNDVGKLVGWRRMEELVDEEGQLVDVLVDGGNTSAAAPVLVQVGLLVREQLHLVRLKAVDVEYHIVCCRCHR